MSRDGDVTYIYFGEHRPVICSLGMPVENGDWEVDVIDTWTMAITPARRIPAPVPVAIKHAGRMAGGKGEAAFGIELADKPRLCV